MVMKKIYYILFVLISVVGLSACQSSTKLVVTTQQNKLSSLTIPSKTKIGKNIDLRAKRITLNKTIINAQSKIVTIGHEGFYPIEREGKTIFISRNITFELNSFKLNEKSWPTLNKLAEKLKQQEEIQVKLTGYTDALGTPKYNQQLSYLRAAAVMKYLREQGVINHITIEGKGETLFIADNNSLTGREQNRRVEFEFL